MSKVPQLPVTAPVSKRQRKFPWVPLLLIIFIGVALSFGIDAILRNRTEVAVPAPAETVSLYENPELIIVRNFEAWQAAAQGSVDSTAPELTGVTIGGERNPEAVNPELRLHERFTAP